MPGTDVVFGLETTAGANEEILLRTVALYLPVSL